MATLPRDVVLSHIKEEFLRGLAAAGKRNDGRGFDAFRPMTIRAGHISRAEGSAEVNLGHSRVFCGVKMAVGTPYPDTPDKGTMATAAELIPMASPEFEPGPPDKNAVEIARVVDRGIRESGVIEMDKLCIEPGEKVWMSFLDMHIVDYDGNLFDACSTAAMTALLNTKVPAEREELGKDHPLPLKKDWPVSTTFAKIGNAVMVDPSLDEEQIMDCRLTVALDPKGDIRAMQKGLNGSFKVEELREVIQRARELGPGIRERIESAARQRSR